MERFEMRTQNRESKNPLFAILQCGDMEFKAPVEDISLGGLKIKDIIRDETLPKEARVKLVMQNGFETSFLPVSFVHDNPKLSSKNVGSGFQFKSLDGLQKRELSLALQPQENVHFL